MIGVFLAAVAEHQASATGLRSFLARTLACSGLAAGLQLAVELAGGTWGRAIVEERALRASAHRADHDAARLWLANAGRTTDAGHGARTLEPAARRPPSAPAMPTPRRGRWRGSSPTPRRPGPMPTRCAWPPWWPR